MTMGTGGERAMERREEHGPFDIIGDIHGCAEELTALLERLGYAPAAGSTELGFVHPEGRRVIFLGDLVDRGPDAPGVLRIAMANVGMFLAGRRGRVASLLPSTRAAGRRGASRNEPRPGKPTAQRQVWGACFAPPYLKGHDANHDRCTRRGFPHPSRPGGGPQPHGLRLPHSGDGGAGGVQ